ncbi:MAG: hypothetical protein Q7R30_03795 [Acidobacteriota bacterium]|nr:hypothetical protein [Acidobacteriota bacterium]
MLPRDFDSKSAAEKVTELFVAAWLAAEVFAVDRGAAFAIIALGKNDNTAAMKTVRTGETRICTSTPSK